jgi:hypothetical protein
MTSIGTFVLMTVGLAGGYPAATSSTTRDKVDAVIDLGSSPGIGALTQRAIFIKTGRGRAIVAPPGSKAIS